MHSRSLSCYASCTPVHSLVFSTITRTRPDSPRHQPAGGLALLRIVLAGPGSGGDWASRGGADASTDRLRQTCAAQSKPVPIFGSGKDPVISYCHLRLKHHEAPGHCFRSPHGKPALTCYVGIDHSAASNRILDSRGLLRCRLQHATLYETHQGHSRIAEVLTSCMNFPQACSNSSQQRIHCGKCLPLPRYTARPKASRLSSLSSKSVRPEKGKETMRAARLLLSSLLQTRTTMQSRTAC